MKKLLKRLVSVVTILVLALSFTACSADPNCGNYKCKNVTVDGISVPASQAFDSGADIVLKTAGACDVTIDGPKSRASWKRDSNKITIFLQQTEWAGTLSGNTLNIEVTEINDSEKIKMVMEFEKE